jgi:hypothetical protein
MAVRRPNKKLSNAATASDDTEQQPLRRPQQTDEGRFRLMVDRQTKCSYETYEAAEAGGMTIKKGHPIVQVTVYDTVVGEFKLVELPK